MVGRWVEYHADRDPYFMIGAFVFYRRPDSPAAQVLLFLGAIRLSINFLFWGSIGENLDGLAFTAVALLGNYIWAMPLFPRLFLLSLVFPRTKQPVRDHPHLTLAALYLAVPGAYCSRWDRRIWLVDLRVLAW